MELPTREVLVEDFRSLPEAGQVRVLCRLAFYLTIEARDYYSADVSLLEANRALKIFNEVQHSIMSQIGSLLDHNLQRYPDETFIKILVDKSQTLSAITIRDLDRAMHKATTKI